MSMSFVKGNIPLHEIYQIDPKGLGKTCVKLLAQMLAL